MCQLAIAQHFHWVSQGLDQPSSDKTLRGNLCAQLKEAKASHIDDTIVNTEDVGETAFLR
jgi:hypothetical protein